MSTRERPTSTSAEILYRPVGLTSSILALFAVVRTAVSRGGARAFERATGEWPGD